MTIVAMLSGDSPIVTPHGKRVEAVASRIQFTSSAASRVQFTSSEGDHISLLKIYRAFTKSNNDKEFCSAHYLQRRNLQFAQEIRKQLIGLCQKNQIPIQSCVGNTDLVRQALAEGMFTNVARLTRDGHYVSVSTYF